MPLTVLDTTADFPGVPMICQARLWAPDATGETVSEEGNLLLAADVSSLTYTVTELLTGTTVLAATSITPSDVFSVLTDDALWRRDKTGRNFKHTVSGTYFPTANRTYRILYELTTTGGMPLKFAFDRRTVPVS